MFAQRFKSTSASATAFGANLLGAMFGGLLEYASLIIGYRTLLVVVALLYGLAFLTGRKELAVTAGDGGGEASLGPVGAAAGGAGWRQARLTPTTDDDISSRVGRSDDRSRRRVESLPLDRARGLDVMS